MEDPHTLVAGQGIQRLKEAGVDVKVNIENKLSKYLNKRFLKNVSSPLPYVILKWAQSADGFMDPRQDPEAGTGGIPISSPESQKWVHLWRSQESALLTGSGTVLVDHPQLNVRKVSGRSPEVFVLDRRGRTAGLHNFTLLSGTLEEGLRTMAQRGHASVWVEGGPTLLNAMLESGLADEVRIIQAPIMLGVGLQAPNMAWPIQTSFECGKDLILYYLRP
jgi:diaminohydroxyphosphoribosylaminopyrimidine deaminase/5-amino-6-(5-phosphoribosylamino)uracil reductase